MTIIDYAVIGYCAWFSNFDYEFTLPNAPHTYPLKCEKVLC